jgi:hypothetical protein
VIADQLLTHCVPTERTTRRERSIDCHSSQKRSSRLAVQFGALGQAYSTTVQLCLCNHRRRFGCHDGLQNHFAFAIQHRHDARCLMHIDAQYFSRFIGALLCDFNASTLNGC